MGLFLFPMKRLIIFFISVLAIGACKPDYKPGKSLTFDEQQRLLTTIVHYSERRAPQSTDETFLDSAFNWYYNLAIKEYDIRQYFRDDDGKEFFLVTRQARSITPMREAIGGYLTKDKDDKLKDYVEEFRMWKMAEDSLNERAFELFGKMVDDKDLSKYGPQFMGDRYIEFPDARFYFDKKRKRWVDSVLDSLRYN